MIRYEVHRPVRPSNQILAILRPLLAASDVWRNGAPAA
jgi:hypothetical protein